nr:hypothetical protein [Tanacetum cinerariifolium]
NARLVELCTPCSKGNVEDKILVPKLPKNYARCTRCGHPVNGSYCQGCALLQKKLEEDLVTYFQDFQNTSESSDDSTNVVNAPREPFVVKQDHDGIFCQQCTCKSSGKGAHIGYNCPPKVLIISNPEPSDAQYGHYCTPQVPFIYPEPGYSQDFNFPQDLHDFQQQYLCCDQCRGPHETFQCFDQTQPSQFPVIHPRPQETSIEILHDQENTINSVQTFLRKFNRYSFFETPKVLLLAWDRVFKIKDAFGNKQYKPKDIQELFRKLFNDVQNIHEDLAEDINTPGWNRPAFYNNDDDDDVMDIIKETKSKQNRTKPSTKQKAWKSEKSTKVNPNKVKATKSSSQKTYNFRGLKLPKLQAYNTWTEVAINVNKLRGHFCQAFKLVHHRDHP